MQNVTSSPSASVLTEVDSIDLAAALIALNFSMAPKTPVSTVQTASLDSQHVKELNKMTWTFLPYSPTAGNINNVLAEWANHVSESTVSPIQYCRLALHNRRVLMTAIAQGAPLYQARIGLVYRLSNYPAAGARKIESGSVDAMGSVSGIYHTSQVAAAVTLGCPLIGYENKAGQYQFFLISSSYLSLGELAAKWNDEPWVKEHDTPLALVIALMRNYIALLDLVKQAPGEIILRKGGKYAVISRDASEAAQLAAARHLNC